MLNFFLTIIAGFIALGFVSSFILGWIALNNRKKANKAYRERVDKAMSDLKEKTGNPNL